MSDKVQQAAGAFASLYDRVFFQAQAAFLADGMSADLAYKLAHQEAALLSRQLGEQYERESRYGKRHI